MPPKIHFGVNLNFSKYVYGRKRIVEVVRRQLGLRHVEMVTDNDFGPVLYSRSPEAFRSYHYSVADHARSQGVNIASVFTVYRDTGGIAHAIPEVRESCFQIGLAMLEQAACYGAKYAGSTLFTMNREEAEDPERYQALFYNSLDCWKRWMTAARPLGLQRLLVETASAYREGCSTIDETRATLEHLDEYHDKNPDSTVPVGLCYDTGHGISPEEDRDDVNRDFRSWFEAFPDKIHEIHLKNTDENFLQTWHFNRAGIISLPDVIGAASETLQVDDLYLFLEVPGKRARDTAERQSIEDHLASIDAVVKALEGAGYSQNSADHVWRKGE